MLKNQNFQKLTDSELLAIKGGRIFECSCITSDGPNYEGITVSGNYDVEGASDVAAGICQGFVDMGVPNLTGGVICS